MARGLGGLLLSVVAAGGALVLGLAGATLRTGRLDPLDWLCPAILAFSCVILSASRGGHAISWGRLGSVWAVVTVPALVFVAWAGLHLPLMGMAVLAISLGLAAIGAGRTRHLGQTARAAMLGGLIVVALLIPRLIGERGASDASRPVVAVLSALPLQGVPMGAAQGLPAGESIGLRSAIWRVLEERIDLRPLDAVDEAALTGVERILLAQPRALAPAELVALDAWVRRGGEAIILSDPLLQWPDPRPLAHPARAPLTSLLDPLLTHWGLRLESAQVTLADEMMERRALASGAMVQLAGASRFSTVGDGSSCALSEQGLIATCRIGAGRALLMADADWINDTLWTHSPEQPQDRRAGTSDAVDLLGAWLTGDEVAMGRWSTWVASEGALIMALRLALLLVLLLGILDWIVARRPSH